MVTSVDARKFVGKRLLSDELDSPSKQVDSIEPKLKKMTTSFATTSAAKKLGSVIDDRRVKNP